MRILWVTSQVLPLVAGQLHVRTTGFGGWVMNMLNQLKQVEDLELGVAMVSTQVNGLRSFQEDGIQCYVAPEKGVKGIEDQDRDAILQQFGPDLIHIEGNEFQIHCAFSRVKSVPVLLSLQGILSGYEPYQYGELPMAEYMVNPGYHNLLTAWILFFRKQFRFRPRLNFENETIRNVQYISGRTFWDRAHSYWMNPQAEYFVCNRILRDVFYKSRWDCDGFEEYSIFVGNGYSPLKGLHFVLDALALLAQEYPEVKLYVAGDCPIVKDHKKFLHKHGYGNLIEKKIKDYGLENNVVFVGSLKGDEMVEKMRRCNVYVLPSLIENSPNTLGEAMMLGMPCVSAYTGGASEMAKDEEECLFYRANDPKLLAWQIRRVFRDKDKAKAMGENAHRHAMHTHDPIRNREMLIEAYNVILENSKWHERYQQ